MERISIFNYEAFYLDFLEGNLNEEDTALLMEFLEANPDLILDDTSLPSFGVETFHLDADIKNSLKQPDENETITTENLSYFMIADSEGLLPNSKSNELRDFIAHDKLMGRDLILFKSVYFEPDLSVVYEDKEGLKQKKIVLWPYLSIAAAASIIAFFLVWSSLQGNVVNELKEKQFANDEQKNIPVEEQTTDNERELNILQDQLPLYALENDSDMHPLHYQQGSDEKKNSSAMQIGKMERRPVGNVLADIGDREIQPITVRTFVPEASNRSTPKDDYAFTAFGNMENPIEPFTKFVEEKTNLDVDFRKTNKSQSGEGKGFFLKIGKFELSRKKH